jgi:putative PIN family toxin of toxin-antitoxin system
MKLVIDTNSIISALIKNGISRRIILSPFIQFITPEYTLQEIDKYSQMICKKAKATKEELNIILQLLFEQIEIIPHEEYATSIHQAKALIDDIDDVPFIALCLASQADGIWSDDAHFKTQRKVSIYRTRELATVFQSSFK